MKLLRGSALLLALAACSTTGGWTKPGVAPEKAARDFAECRHVAELANRRDSNIDADIMATRGQDWERIGLLEQKRDEDANSSAPRTGSIVDRCMTGKGYTAG